jgi:hypothetical protein
MRLNTNVRETIIVDAKRFQDNSSIPETRVRGRAKLISSCLQHFQQQNDHFVLEEYIFKSLMHASIFRDVLEQ